MQLCSNVIMTATVTDYIVLA